MIKTAIYRYIASGADISNVYVLADYWIQNPLYETWLTLDGWTPMFYIWPIAESLAGDTVFDEIIDAKGP